MIPEVLLQPMQSMLDKGVTNSTTAAALCAQLEGRTLQIAPAPEELALYFAVSNGQLLVNPGVSETPDATISGSLLNLARLVGDDPEGMIRAGDVSISGDADVATDFRALLAITQPDWEEELSRLTGDVLAHEVGRAFKGVAGWAARTRHSLGRSVTEYLSEESRDLVATTELKEFYAEVDQLAMSVERTEAKFRLLKNAQQGLGD